MSHAVLSDTFFLSQDCSGMRPERFFFFLCHWVVKPNPEHTVKMYRNAATAEAVLTLLPTCKLHAESDFR